MELFSVWPFGGPFFFVLAVLKPSVFCFHQAVKMTPRLSGVVNEQKMRTDEFQSCKSIEFSNIRILPKAPRDEKDL